MKRALLRFHSVRARLALWNVSVMALMLAALGVTLHTRVQQDLLVSVDRELAERARRMMGMFPGFWFGPPLGGPPPGGPPPRGRRGRGRPPWGGLGGPPFERGPRPDRPPPLSWLAPRMMDQTGRVLSPPTEHAPWDRAALGRAQRGEAVYSITTVEGEPLRVLSLPILQNGVVTYIYQFAHPLTDTYRALRGLRRTLLTLIPIALLIAAGGGLFLTERALRPVRQMAQAAGRIGAKDLSERLPIVGNDEFAELAATFNGMLARLEEAFAKMKAVLEQQRRFTGDASHELRTPLTVIKAHTNLALRSHRTAEEYQRALQAIQRAADTMHHIVQDLLLLARADGGQLARNVCETPITEILQRAIEAAQKPEGAPVTLNVPDASVTVTGNIEELTRLFANLIDNALRHTPADGRITVSARPMQDAVLITVADTGEGIPPEHLPHVCERFYRVDAARSRADGGSGLGLSICQSIVEAHQGKMTIQSELGKGTTVHITFPKPGVVNPVST
ncbi:MAG: ATP-binding protein [Abditibacteriales bacterium]|nr:ATP-binding protein [Abditibacteriales bacterium]MDW8365892.1 ATP-binding protein [Abditibacteriales bacterium]